MIPLWQEYLLRHKSPEIKPPEIIKEIEVDIISKKVQSIEYKKWTTFIILNQAKIKEYYFTILNDRDESGKRHIIPSFNEQQKEILKNIQIRTMWISWSDALCEIETYGRIF